MSTDKELGQKLMKANGIEPIGMSSEDRRALHAILARDKRRARHMKYLTKILWVLVFLTLAGHLAAKLMSEQGPLDQRHLQPPYLVSVTLAIAMMFLFYLALFSTGWYGIRVWIARNRETQVQITEMQLSLASIAEQLKRMADGG